MGDFLPPGQVTAVDYERLRRRVERYRQLQASRQQHYDSFQTNIYPQQAHETQLLHKRWQDSITCKKPLAKSSAAKVARNADSATLPGAQASAAAMPTKKFKRTANGQFKSASAESPPTSSGPAEASYSGFDGHQSPAVVPPCGVTPMHNSVSVNINVDANLHRSQSEIKLTFSSTINGHAAQTVPGPAAQQQSVPSMPMNIVAGDYCKSEHSCTNTPGDTGGAAGQQNSPPYLPDNIDNLEDFDDLSDLLDKFADDGNDTLPADILTMLDESDRCFESQDFANGPHPPAPTSREPSVVATSRYGPTMSGFGVTSSAAPVVPFTTAQAIPAKVVPDACVGIIPPSGAPTLLGDTGPAAETLKQMAAQHQSQENAIGRHYAAGPYGDGFHPGSFSNAPKLPRYPAQQYASGYMMTPAIYQFDGSGRSGYGAMDPMAGCVSPMEAACYRPTRFVQPSGSAGMQTSLQRLESQVHSHFAPNPGVGPSPVDVQHFRMEQSQRIDMRGQQIAMAQQQSFSMSMDAAAAGTQQQMYHRERCTQPAYGQYAGPVPYRMMPGYQCMPQGGPTIVQVPAGTGSMQPGAAMNGMLGRNQQPASAPSYSGSVRPAEPGTQSSGRLSANSKASGRLQPGPAMPGMTPMLPTKVESAGGGYPPPEQPSDNSRVLKSSEAVSGYSSSVVKAGHRPPNVTVGPCGSMNMNFQPVGKWVPRGPAMQGHMMSGVPGNYISNYPVDEALPAARMEAPVGSAAGWTMSMSQTQSVYVAGGQAPGPAAFHPGTSELNFSRSHSRQGYGTPNVCFQAMPGSGMPSGDGIMHSTSDYAVVQRNSRCATTGQNYVESFPANCATQSDFGFGDDVFVGK